MEIVHLARNVPTRRGRPREGRRGRSLSLLRSSLAVPFSTHGLHRGLYSCAVEPRELKPRFLRSLLIVADSGVLAGTRCPERQAFICGFPPTNCQMYLSNDPNSFSMSRK